MKKTLVMLTVALGLVTFNAQENSSSPVQIQKGNWMVEANTGFGGGEALAGRGANTGIGFVSSESNTDFSVGFEGGYFPTDRLVLKGGLGYTYASVDVGGIDSDGSIFSYMLGTKYYIIDKIPVQIDFRGSALSDNFENVFEENPMWLGFQAGYALFIGEKIALEPAVKYNLSLNQDFPVPDESENVFEARLGFVLFF